MHALALALLASLPAADAAPRLELGGVTKIWDAGKHNAFTDLIRFGGRWYCTFREGDAHVGGDGKLRVLVSADGVKWESAALLAEAGIDLRDPKFSVTPDGRLMMVAGGSVYEGKKLLGRQPRVAFSKDGKDWTPTKRVLGDGDWLWRVTWHGGKCYGVSYNAAQRTTPEAKDAAKSGAAPPGPAEWKLKLWASADGEKYDLVTHLDVPGHPNETTLRFRPDGELVALVRREGGDQKGWVGTSKAPYMQWAWKELPARLGGPNFVFEADRPTVATTRLYDGKVRTAVCLLDPAVGTLSESLVLPSGGDTSYAGMVWHDGLLWVSYYSSHEGKSAIYLAKVKVTAAEMPRVVVSKDGTGFVLAPSGKAFVPWGFNYDHDEKGRLIEDYWDAEWPKVERDFRAMKALGANVVRVHLQLGKFLDAADRPNAKSLDRLGRLLALAEAEGLYLDLTGLGCYHKADVPGWYDALDEAARWDAQARFWEAVAGRCQDSPAVFCYDLMNEPVVPGGRRAAGDWLGPAFGGKHFVQFVALDPKGRPRPEVARAWVKHLTAAVRRADPRGLVTVGLVDWSLDRPGLTSGFVPKAVAADLDFVCIHLYPESGKLDAARETLRGFAVGKPVVVEETFPLKCSPKELDEFIDRCGRDAAGWVSFYWGTPPAELRRSKEIRDVILLDWLTRFETRAARRSR